MTSAKPRKKVAAEEVWLKRSSNTLGLGAPLVIMAIGKSGEHQWWGEYSILISGGTTAYLSQRTTLNTANVPEDILGGYSSFMKMEVEQQVQTRFSVHLFELYEKTKSDYALQKIDLVDAVKEDVIRLWLRGHLHKEIKKIKDTTQSETAQNVSYKGWSAAGRVYDQISFSVVVRLIPRLKPALNQYVSECSLTSGY